VVEKTKGGSVVPKGYRPETFKVKVRKSGEGRRIKGEWHVGIKIGPPGENGMVLGKGKYLRGRGLLG